ncbi:lamina-associated polypeptide 2, isoforms alpha/zeta-like [Protopterus annectens]|uniref:lamina-associated polypeptide 2, isoforms alpha/zeta-like n=1 Tax=Protopterus annectens TaxID=7888 RepID=UPI001CFA551A|nr:lamina-associated polypeptide 2, isoforms alpha/zeta-like [Protopterus annectens]XP_043940092.1 lamina-associated polypeptide 2, isoforms alpha/zeta-like [Protopterus annectens]
MAESTHEGGVALESVEEDARSVDTIPLEGDTAEQLGEESAMEVEVGAAETGAQAVDEESSSKKLQGRKELRKGAEIGTDVDLEKVPRGRFLFNTSEGAQFIDDVCQVLNLTAVKPQIKPDDANGSEKTPNWVNFPPVEEFESLIKNEWRNASKKWSRFGYRRRMYPFPREWTRMWGAPPTVDSVVCDFVKDSVVTRQGKAIPRDGATRRLDYVSQRAFIVSGQIITATSAASYVAQALVSWLDQFSQALPEDLKEHKSLPLLQSSAKFLSDATHNVVRAAARASVAQTTVRRALWLRNLGTSTGLKHHMLNLPFKGDQLFGDGINELMKQVKESAKLYPSGRLRGFGGFSRGTRGSMRGPGGFGRGTRGSMRGSGGFGRGTRGSMRGSGRFGRGTRGSMRGTRGGFSSRATTRRGNLTFSAKFAAVRASLIRRGGRRGRRSFRGGPK